MSTERGNEADAPLPITVIGGYLGSGKTTLVNYLLRHAEGRRLGVLVNDFGTINIDADLIEAKDGELIRLTGGCVCCQFGDDLSAAVMRLAALPAPSRPDHLVLETSGVALPGPLLASLRWMPGLAIDAALVVVDALNVRRLADDRFVGDVVRAQLTQADLLVLSKGDLVSDEGEVRQWLRTVTNAVAIVSVMDGAIDASLVLGPRPSVSGLGSMTAQTPQWRTDPGRATDRFVSATLAVGTTVADPTGLAARIAAIPGLWRAKGFVRDAGGHTWLVQVVGGRATITPWSSTVDTGTIVCIGAVGDFDQHLLDSSITDN